MGAGTPGQAEGAEAGVVDGRQMAEQTVHNCGQIARNGLEPWWGLLGDSQYAKIHPAS